MEIERIKALIRLVGSNPVSELTLTEGGSRIRIVKATGGAPSAPAWPVARQLERATPIPPEASREAALVRAPMPGLFHVSPAPGEPPFVTEGDSVEPGRQLCVIEAMKVFNAVTAGRAGRIEAVLVASGEMVQADQPLFRMA